MEIRTPEHKLQRIPLSWVDQDEVIDYLWHWILFLEIWKHWQFSSQKSFVWVELDFFLLQSGEICKRKNRLFETQDLDWNQWVRLSSKTEVWSVLRRIHGEGLISSKAKSKQRFRDCYVFFINPCSLDTNISSITMIKFGTWWKSSSFVVTTWVSRDWRTPDLILCFFYFS
jgi:hypothetical protein